MWNGKVRCISSDGSWKVGETYCILNGSIQFANGNFSHNKFLSLEDVNVFFNSKFELVRTPKKLLKDGDYVILRSGRRYIASLEFDKFFSETGGYIRISDSNEDLVDSDSVKYDVMKIERGSEIIWEREEKFAKQIEVENIKNEMKKLADRLEAVFKVEKEL